MENKLTIENHKTFLVPGKNLSAQLGKNCSEQNRELTNPTPLWHHTENENVLANASTLLSRNLALIISLMFGLKEQRWQTVFLIRETYKQVPEVPMCTGVSWNSSPEDFETLKLRNATVIM